MIKKFEGFFDDYGAEKDEMKRRIYSNVDDILCVLNDNNISSFIKFDNLNTVLTITLKKGKPDTYLTYNDWRYYDLDKSESFSYDDVIGEVEHMISYIIANNEFSFLSELKIDYNDYDNNTRTQKFGPPGTRNLYDGVESDIDSTIEFVQSKVDFCKEIHFVGEDNNWIKRLTFEFRIKYK